MQFTFSPASLAQHAHPADHPQLGTDQPQEADAEGGQHFGEMLAESAQRHRGILPQLGEGSGQPQPPAQQPPAATAPQVALSAGERVGQHIAGMLETVQTAQTAPQLRAEEATPQAEDTALQDAALTVQLGQDEAAVAEAAPRALRGESQYADVKADTTEVSWSAPIAALFEPNVEASQHTETDVQPRWDVQAPSLSTAASFSASTAAQPIKAPVQEAAQDDTAAAAARTQAETDAEELRAERQRQSDADLLAREQAEASFRAALWSAPYPGMLAAEHAAPITQAPVDVNEQAWQSSLTASVEPRAQNAAPPALAANELRPEAQEKPEALDADAEAAPSPAAANAAAATSVAPSQPSGAGQPQQGPSDAPSRNQPAPGIHGANHTRQPVGTPRANTPAPGAHDAQAQERDALGALGGAAAAPAQAGDLGQSAVNASVRSDAPQAAQQVQQPAAPQVPELPRAIASEQLAATLAQSAAQGVGNIRLRIMPEGLGELDVRLRVQRGQVRLQIEGEAPELAQLIGRNMHALREALGQHALTLDELQFNSPSSEQEQAAGSANSSFEEFAERNEARDTQTQGQEREQGGVQGQPSGTVAAATLANAEPPRRAATTRVIDVTL